jgi:hypothetical protein
MLKSSIMKGLDGGNVALKTSRIGRELGGVREFILIGITI